MSGNDKRRDAAKEIAKKVQERRREKQYQIMLDWRDGYVTGLVALDQIAELETLVDLRPEDFKPPMPKQLPPPVPPRKK